MKRLIVIALLCIVAISVKAQSIFLRDSYPSSNNEAGYASAPVLTLDSLTGYLHYSFTVNYPSGSQRSDVQWGGSYLYIGLVLDPYGSIVNLLEFNDETEDIAQLASGQVTHSGSFYIGSYYSNLRNIFVAGGNGCAYYSDPYNGHGFYIYDEYDFIP
ncbi:MAG: hypothetical protein EOO91_02040 [Pedobacter sp.]|nr:MAG: hypothetical protein EOO91_02040 [Pedobacter sp.]